MAVRRGKDVEAVDETGAARVDDAAVVVVAEQHGEGELGHRGILATKA